MDVLWPWLLATLVFLVLVGSGRTLGGAWLARPPFGAGLALSAALGVALFSLLWMGLGQLGALRTPWPWLVFGAGALLALPGLVFTWRDWRQPAPGLERGFGPAWFAAPAALVLAAALVISMVWISGAFEWEGRSFLFEPLRLDYEIGRTVLDPERPRDPYLGDEPLGLWLYGLGSPEASLALSWWLGVALLFGVCGMGWRLHAHGAGLAAAALLALVLFASDRPLLLAPALPASLALVAVMVLAIEGRGRPRAGRSIVAGALGGYALISEPGSAAMLAPLLLFGPSWCKKGGFGDAAYGDDYREDSYADEGPQLSFAKKWATPLRHTGLGALGLTLPLVPWLARSDAWTGDPCYGYREPTFQLRMDYAFDAYEPDYGVAALDEYRVFDDYLDATEWGLGIGLLAALSPWYGWRRREPVLYLAPGLMGYAAGAALGDGDLTTPSALALLSVGAGSTLYSARQCSPGPRTLGLGGTLAAGGLSLGLSGAYDCGYWDDFDEFDEGGPPRVQLSLRYDYLKHEDPPPEEPVYDYDFDLKATLRFDPKLDFGLRYAEYAQPLDEPPPEEDPSWQPEWQIGPGIGYELPGLRLDYPYRQEDEATGEGQGEPPPPSEPDPEDPPTVPQQPEEAPGTLRYQFPADRPRLPIFRPDIRPDIDVRPQPPRPPTTQPPRGRY